MADNQWHLDKRVPVAIIFAIILQSIAAFWWAATMTEKVAALEIRVARLGDYQTRLVRVEARSQSTIERLDRIESLQRSINDKLDNFILRQIRKRRRGGR